MTSVPLRGSLDGWTKRFIFFHRKRHPAAMGADEVNAFLSHLAVEGNVSASTQAQALSALGADFDRARRFMAKSGEPPAR